MDEEKSETRTKARRGEEGDEPSDEELSEESSDGSRLMLRNRPMRIASIEELTDEEPRDEEPSSRAMRADR